MGRKVEVIEIGNAIERLRKGETALDAERRAMKEALELLGKANAQIGTPQTIGRLILVLDLTGSREANLIEARKATSAMFEAIKSFGNIAMKLIHFRGFAQCVASEWHNDPESLRRTMLGLSCRIGETKIARALQLVLAEEHPISGVVYVGDHCEDDPAEIETLARKLGQKSIPIFVFHECSDHDRWSLDAAPVFQRIAEFSGGVYVEFKPDSSVVLKEMLSNVAVFSTAGAEGVQRFEMPVTPEARQLRTRLLLSSGGNK